VSRKWRRQPQRAAGSLPEPSRATNYRRVVVGHAFHSGDALGSARLGSHSCAESQRGATAPGANCLALPRPQALAGVRPAGARLQRSWCWWVPNGHLRGGKGRSSWGIGVLAAAPQALAGIRSGRSEGITTQVLRSSTSGPFSSLFVLLYSPLCPTMARSPCPMSASRFSRLSANRAGGASDTTSRDSCQYQCGTRYWTVCPN
jgi:hypothetical protein